MKFCNGCKENKPLEDFHKSAKYGTQYRCKPCVREYWRARHYDTYYMKTYGITREEFDSMVEAQGGLCAVCGRDNNGKPLCVDHNHTTGEVRELLCTPCNAALGQLQEDPERINALAAYAIKHARKEATNG